ncbi:MAG: hypothetical protein R3C49_25355 [Planctomycetaceae bacterium]
MLSILILLTNSFIVADELMLRADVADAGDLLILNNGRVVTGRLLARTGGYDVILPTGRMYVSSEQIRFRAATLDDAYLKMRASLAEFTPGTHVDLARWCLTNHLPAQARRELLDALHLDPQHTDARLILEGIQRQENQRRLMAEQEVSQVRQARLDEIRSGAPLPPRRSLGGLPAELAQSYTRTVQPLLSARCGNVRCHGADRHEFQLISARQTTSSVIAEQNLAAILNQIDLQRPMESPLLQATQGLHGGSRELLFPGQSGRRQIQLLTDWIAAVSAELSPHETTVAENNFVRRQMSGTASSEIIQTAGRQEDFETLASDMPSADVVSEVGTRLTADDTAPKFLKAAAVAVRHDDFDPNLFNQRYHGTVNADSGLPATSESDTSRRESR